MKNNLWSGFNNNPVMTYNDKNVDYCRKGAAKVG